jgi:hypothetical protein
MNGKMIRNILRPIVLLEWGSVTSMAKHLLQLIQTRWSRVRNRFILFEVAQEITQLIPFIANYQ